MNFDLKILNEFLLAQFILKTQRFLVKIFLEFQDLNLEQIHETFY